MEDGGLQRETAGVRSAGLALGITTHILFLITVIFLFQFLRWGRPDNSRHWLLVDSLLALQFGLLHSLILHPVVKKRLTRRIKPEWYGLFFCLSTCGCLTLIFAFWRGSSGVVWEATGATRKVIECGFYGSWVGLIYSLSLSGLGYQTGLTPWLYWLRRQPAPHRQLVMHNLYRWLRHPAYLSFLGLIWFTPRMSWDHALLTTIWTVYIFIGSYLKDERLAFYAGEAYRKYQQQVPGYPFMPWGVLARRPKPCRPFAQMPLGTAELPDTTLSKVA